MFDGCLIVYLYSSLHGISSASSEIRSWWIIYTVKLIKNWLSIISPAKIFISKEVKRNPCRNSFFAKPLITWLRILATCNYTCCFIRLSVYWILFISLNLAIRFLACRRCCLFLLLNMNKPCGFHRVWKTDDSLSSQCN